MKKGISFTLTIVIVGVILLTAALTLVTVFGASIGNFFGVLSEQGTDAAVRNECVSVARQIDNQICNAYTRQGGSINDLSPQRTPPDYITTCSEAGCTLNLAGGEETLQYDGGSVQLEVTVEGDTYNCYDEGYIENTCPMATDVVG